jgi:hypothetical protein
MCRPVAGVAIAADGALPLTPHGPSRELEFHAIGPDGQPVRLLAGTMFVSDTQVATVRGLTVVPKNPGSSRAELDIGDCVLLSPIDVHERVTDPSLLRRRDQLFAEYPLRLARGESRSWRLQPGEYRIGLLPAGAGVALALSVDAMRCDGHRGELQDYVCSAHEGATVTVRNTRGDSIASNFFVKRWDVPAGRQDDEQGGPRRRSASGKRFCSLRG